MKMGSNVQALLYREETCAVGYMQAEKIYMMRITNLQIYKQRCFFELKFLNFRILLGFLRSKIVVLIQWLGYQDCILWEHLF